MTLHYLPLHHCAKLISNGQLDPLELTEHMLARIEQLNPQLNAFVCVHQEKALDAATQASNEIKQGHYRGPLHGIPIAVKDLCFIKDQICTVGSAAFAHYQPNYSATVVQRLDHAGAINLGTLALTEGAFAGYGQGRKVPVNPWHAQRWSGLSSSGSAVSVAAGLCFAALGSDTGGSIRFPAACNNVVGLKPSYGRVSRYGMFPLANSLDHIGPMSRDVLDCAIIYQCIAGFDERDKTSLRRPVDSQVVVNPYHLKLVVDVDYNARAQRAVQRKINLAVQRFKDIGFSCGEIRLPNPAPAVQNWTTIAAYDAAQHHATQFTKHGNLYGKELSGLIAQGQRLRAADYQQALKRKQDFSRQMHNSLAADEILLCPAMPTMVPDQGDMIDAKHQAQYADSLLAFTTPFNFSGQPTLSLPLGFDEQGCPMGLQLVASLYQEQNLLALGQLYQQASSWLNLHPAI